MVQNNVEVAVHASGSTSLMNQPSAMANLGSERSRQHPKSTRAAGTCSNSAGSRSSRGAESRMALRVAVPSARILSSGSAASSMVPPLDRSHDHSSKLLDSEIRSARSPRRW